MRAPSVRLAYCAGGPFVIKPVAWARPRAYGPQGPGALTAPDSFDARTGKIDFRTRLFQDPWPGSVSATRSAAGRARLRGRARLPFRPRPGELRRRLCLFRHDRLRRLPSPQGRRGQLGERPVRKTHDGGGVSESILACDSAAVAAEARAAWRRAPSAASRTVDAGDREQAEDLAPAVPALPARQGCRRPGSRQAHERTARLEEASVEYV